MKKKLIAIGISLIVLGILGFLIFGKVLRKPGKAALQIATTPDSKVFLNNEEVGVTPYFNDKLDAGEYTVKLVPQDQAGGLTSWEGKVSLVSNIVTSINYQLRESQEKLSGEILSLEKIDDPRTSSLAVVSQPDEALVKLGGESRGFTPVLVEDLSPAEYQVVVSAPGFVERTITAQTIAGYKLNVSVKLAQEELEGVAEATESAESEEESEEEEEPVPTEAEEEEEESEEELKTTSSPIDLENPYVLIKETPTGWLRVRAEASTESEEVAKVDPGEAFPYLDEEENGWYKIEYEEGEEGWVSGVYADLVE
jgi:hypothetical protein